MSLLSFMDGGAPIEPKAEVVDMLETLLAHAKAGQVVALSVATVRPDGTTGTAFNEGIHPLQLVAATTILLHRIVGGYGE